MIPERDDSQAATDARRDARGMVFPSADGSRYYLQSPTFMPRASGFLWNRRMMLQVNCRGFVIAQHMQPEPAKYSYAPNLEAKTFMQPEQPYYAHHPGRFIYVRDDETMEIFSAPYEPVRRAADRFSFSVGMSDIAWHVVYGSVEIDLSVNLAVDDVVELWSLHVTSRSREPRSLSVFPYFTPGYMSWMNQSAEYREDLGAVVASCVTPYQRYTDYLRNKHLKDHTYLLHDRVPTAWQTQREAFEGDGGLHNPDALRSQTLACDDARYETPVAALQYRLTFEPDTTETFRFAFGPAIDDDEIRTIRERYMSVAGFTAARADCANYVARGRGALRIETPDDTLDNFVNHWLPRQVYYHGDANRLTTDPQTRNYLQDAMGMAYIRPATTRSAFLHALAQQASGGAMPDGILLTSDAELKYINQVPHTDHCVWLPVCLKAYLDETGDRSILDETVIDADGVGLNVFERIDLAMEYLVTARDERGLSYIAQGDWCDPMNMVGYKGKGVSGWLSIATSYALRIWSDLCRERGSADRAALLASIADAIDVAVNEHLWDGEWYARGITDDGVVFGVRTDREGTIFLNPQSWAILAGTCTGVQRESMIRAVEDRLETPYGVAMLAPAFTAMREDVGRVTQKHPGSAENGSVYNHAAIFYIYSLYTIEEADRAYRLLRQMIPGPETADLEQRGQMPVYIPNYYRGAYRQFPRTAGRSSQLFNTGTVSWFYRSLIDGLFGLRGDGEDLVIAPNLPSHWPTARVVRLFRGATLRVEYTRDHSARGIVVEVDGTRIESHRISILTAGRTYQLSVTIGDRETMG